MIPRPEARAALAAAVLALSAGLVAAAPGGPAGATTTAGTVVGEGGSYLQPVTNKLLKDDGAGLAPGFGAYTDVTLDQGLADFAGTGPGAFGADYAVTERPLSAAEASTAQANGRTFAYVPFAAGPVAVVTTVPNDTFQGQSLQPSDFCPHIPLTLTLLADIFGFDSANPMLQWSDPRLQCSAPGTTADGVPVSRWANLDPTMENQAIMTLLDSTPSSKTLFSDGLQNAFANSHALTTDPTPAEQWPYSQNTIPGGDQPLLGKLIGINALTNAPSTTAADWHLGAALPISSVWTGAPLGVPWDLPTAAIQNAQGAFVAPSAAAAAAAEADATLASTNDPATNNLVTFNPSGTDAAAYNNFLMEESYLVVPTNGLPADKATALAQFVRFVLGKTGQADITSLGAAPATTAMVAAGLKVAQELNVEAAAASANASTGATTTTTTTAPTTTTTAGATTSTTAAGATSTGGTSTGGSASSSSSGTGSGGSSSGLAFTGSDPLPILVVGLALVAIGEVARRRLRRRRVVR